MAPPFRRSGVGLLAATGGVVAGTVYQTQTQTQTQAGGEELIGRRGARAAVWAGGGGLLRLAR
ncbi:hypothetical protein GCM10012285_24820 [Streptomyces kronopolitis]|uniref:Uncharacterized protein n=1 Tax=Streptomyces kronopolitis TaxID=1612435 RepID=A0ABQ2JDB9_9ACTN|nr:hypothetical protein GCM10012285_24820 [Streptomyces kronopolitis]